LGDRPTRVFESDHRDIMRAQLSAPMVLTPPTLSAGGPVSNPIRTVFLLGSPPQIGGLVVLLVTVQMPKLLSSRSRREKQLCDQRMNWDLAPHTLHVQNNQKVPV
jgi:hypothetical protein